MRTKYLLCADRIIFDQAQNKTSAIDIIENFNSSVFPLAFPRFCVLWALDRDAGDSERYTAKVKIKLNDDTLGEFDMAVDFSGLDSTRAALQIGNLALPSPGVLVVAVSIPALPQLPSVDYSVKVGSVLTNASLRQSGANGATH